MLAVFPGPIELLTYIIVAVFVFVATRLLIRALRRR
jgi:hypothetical protein